MTKKLEYVNLHLHTEYSALDGFARLEDVVDAEDKVVMKGIVTRLKEIGHTACTTTDHASLSAVYPAYNAFKKAGIKYLPGIEFYLVKDRTIPRGQMHNHLVVIARNKKGWENILKMNYIGFETGPTTVFDRVVPRIDMGVLEQYTEGLLVSSACLGGIPAQLVKVGEIEEATAHAKKMQAMFRDKTTGEDCYFLEVQCVDFYRMLSDTASTSLIDKAWIERQARDQKLVNDRLLDIAKKNNIPVVCTTDAHYVSKEDRDAHLLLLAIQSKSTMETRADGPGGRLAFEATAMLSTDELLKAFTETESGYNGYSEDQVKEWMQNTVKAAALVEEPKYLEPSGYKIPVFPVSESNDIGSFVTWKNSLDPDQIKKILG